ncbi:MAG: hypothetical protein WAL98_20405 [Desulfatiglandaceae bacterium]
MADPRTSKRNEIKFARIFGIVKLNWAKLMMIKGMINPQNTMRWAMPIQRFFKTCFCPERYFRRPIKFPVRSSFCPRLKKVQRFLKPTSMIKRATAINKGSKAVNNDLSPPSLPLIRERLDIKYKSTDKENKYKEQV